jgi:hypothetical protein
MAHIHKWLQLLLLACSLVGQRLYLALKLHNALLLGTILLLQLKQT